MKNKTLLLAVTILLSINGIAQVSKMNFDLVRKVADRMAQEEFVPVLIKGNVESVKAEVKQMGGNFKYNEGNIMAVDVQVKNIKKLAERNDVNRIEAYTPHLVLMNDSMRVKTRVNDVQAGLTPLLQGYDGKGVVIGIIDSGTDFNHPDFKTANGKTRIKYIWDHTKPNAANTPAPYNYGQEWDSTKIENGLCTHADTLESGHGTISTGIAAGNGLASGKEKGVAPEADIIVVAVDYGSTAPNRIADACKYIFAKAQAMGKPCVINASLGDYYGSHDGKNLEAQLINNLLQTNGRAMTASAGNLGSKYIHLGYNTSATDTNFTWFQQNLCFGVVYMQLWGDTNTFKNVKYSVGVDSKITSYGYVGRTPFRNMASTTGVFNADTIKNSNGKRIGVVQSYGDIVGGVYSMEFFIQNPDSANYFWRLNTTGTGKFDLWAFDCGRAQATEMVYTGLPTATTHPEISNYKLPDTTQTIVSSFQCLDSVITVGNYMNRNQYIAYDNLTKTFAGTPNAIDRSSSIGPTRDGRIKPDIAAPGGITLTAWPVTLLNWYKANNPGVPSQDGWHIRSGGTSASAPVVAGVAALYLQKNPTANAMQVKNAITACPFVDAFSGSNLPNTTWGYGKVNAFTALAGCSVGINNSNGTQANISIFPNPFNNTATVNYELKGTTAQLKIYDVVGKLQSTIQLKGNVGQQTISRNNLTNGSYFLSIEVDGKLVKTEKIVITE